jgi:hypothetical protein
VTDQPRERPKNGPLTGPEREKHVILSLDAPPASDVGACISLVAAIFTFIDSLSKITLRPETKIKIKKAREELDKDLKKDLEKEKKGEVRKSAAICNSESYQFSRRPPKTGKQPGARLRKKEFQG